MGEPISEPLSNATGCPCTLPALGLPGMEPGAEPGPSEPLSKFSGCPCSQKFSSLRSSRCSAKPPCSARSADKAGLPSEHAMLPPQNGRLDKLHRAVMWNLAFIGNKARV